jgi:hypothetical protein
VMAELSALPMSQIAAELRISKTTAYDRLRAAREWFEREWASMRERREPAALAFMLWEPSALIAADRSLPDAPPGFTDDVLHRLRERLGPDLAWPIASAVAVAGAVTAARLAASAGATKAGTVTLPFRQVAIGAVLVLLAGMGLRGALGPSTHPSAPPTAASSEPMGAGACSAAEPAEIATAALAPQETPARVASTPAPRESDGHLMYRARALVRAGEIAQALAVLGRVTDPDLVAERDELRRHALAFATDAGGL